MKKKEEIAIHDTFEVAIWLKLLNAVLEIIGGLFFLFLKPSRLNEIILKLTQHELAVDPRDLIANFLRHWAANFSISNELFTGIFLLSHGLIKGGLVIALLKRKLWAYPLAIVIFLGFITYQTYQYFAGGSAWLLALNALDIAVVILTALEYRDISTDYTH